MFLRTLVLAVLVSCVGWQIQAQAPAPISVVASVTQCGADPSGKADSMGAFNGCLKTAPSGDIWVPAGEYKITGTIVKSRNRNLIGAGSKASMLQCQSTTAPCLVFADTTGGVNNYADSRIQDLTIQALAWTTPVLGSFLVGTRKESSIRVMRLATRPAS